MKRYKLLKDTPTAAAGTICKAIGEQGHVIVDPYGVEYDVAKIDDFDEWFEEIKEFEEWKPKDGENYKLLYLNGDAISMCFYSGKNDQYYLSIGNCYPLDTPDELIIKEQKLIPQALHRLKMAAKKAWFEFNGSEGPDWSDCGQHKYYVYYNWTVSNKGFHVVDTDSANVFGCIYFPTEESAQTYIDNNLDDLKLLFGVE